MNLGEAGFVILHSAPNGNQNFQVHLFKPSRLLSIKLDLGMRSRGPLVSE